MKILFYIESLRAGGKERRLVELIKGLKKYPDIEMELVLTREDIHYTEIFDTGIKIHYTVRKGIKKDPRLFWKFYKIARQFKPDIIHVWGNMVAVYAIPAKVLLGIPMVNNQITNAPLKVKGGLLSHKITFIFSDKIIANSYAGIKAYKVPKEKSSVIYNGFDFDRVNSLKKEELVRKSFNIKTNYIVGMVASFSKTKDYKTYIEAALKVLSTRSDVTFLCVGDGESDEYKVLIPKKWKPYFLFLGKQKNVESVMNICHIGVLSTFSEGISNTILEFMALGKPVIATGKGGTKEIIDNGNNGIHIEAGNPKLLSKKIDILLGDSDLRKNMGMHAQKTVMEKFSMERMVSLFVKEYNTLYT